MSLDYSGVRTAIYCRKQVYFKRIGRGCECKRVLSCGSMLNKSQFLYDNGHACLSGSKHADLHAVPASAPATSSLSRSIERAAHALLDAQHAEGYWSFHLEADCTISAEYILMMHHMDEIDDALQTKIAAYIRARQLKGGGWPLYFDGNIDLSCSVKSYYALKLAGDDPDAPHMQRARKAILEQGGAGGCNVFTRIMLAQFGQIPWQAVPYLPVEIMLLPRWFPFHLNKVSYWSRTVMVPLLVLCTLKRSSRNPGQIGIPELLLKLPKKRRHYFPVRSGLNRLFLYFEFLTSLTEPFIPDRLRQRALKKAGAWITERLNGGLGAIFPAMINAYEALDALGYSADHPYRQSAKKALQDLLVVQGDEAYCQPCNSPVWDTALATLALQEAEYTSSDTTTAATDKALDWLKEQQLLDEPGDWREHRPELSGGGWAFQFSNSHYPDLDDTSAVAWPMCQADQRAQTDRYQYTIQRAANWVRGMQSGNGGFASFDVDNTYEYLNEIPFADHGALLDPPSSDVSARCAILLACMASDDPAFQTALDHCMTYLRQEQEVNGSWFGRWGTNYIYGTWSVLVALEKVGIAPQDAMVRRAADWLKSVQRHDGGWGEDHDTYCTPEKAGQGRTSTTFQTAWALLGLMAAGETASPEVERGIAYLQAAQQANGLWHDDAFTAPGFPRVFYLKYHGYDKYFPLWALARYRKLHLPQNA